ncbi:hypothetical protein H0266_06825 [Halobacillus locisalis]|uniref:Uncharacterized protein n=1 Tax=Halobacillus locisalis TaxID=220753 RepID=A0A838CR62_9BACI|nr:hypothetical protein [Halobacillus locisalis]MBA2174622.1 hypothetical protein [Halobacillus locisalis]
MASVHLEMTEKQYKKLIEAVYLGTWMVNSTKMDLDEDFEEMRELVLSNYNQAGLDDLVVHQKEMDIHDLDVDFESKLLDTYVEEYDEFSFWDKLVEKLADKEMVKQFGAPKGEMTEEMMEKRIQFEEQIGQKLEESGITELDFTEK